MAKRERRHWWDLGETGVSGGYLEMRVRRRFCASGGGGGGGG